MFGYKRQRSRGSVFSGAPLSCLLGNNVRAMMGEVRLELGNRRSSDAVSKRVCCAETETVLSQIANQKERKKKEHVVRGKPTRKKEKKKTVGRSFFLWVPSRLHPRRCLLFLFLKMSSSASFYHLHFPSVSRGCCRNS